MSREQHVVMTCLHFVYLEPAC